MTTANKPGIPGTGWNRRTLLGLGALGAAAPLAIASRAARAQGGPKLAVPAPAPVLLPVAGSDALYPVRRIYCIGFNYREHNIEMQRSPEAGLPPIFNKPIDAVVQDGATVPYPLATENFHYEIELVVAIGTGGTGIPEARALDHVFGYAVGNDLTRRDLQLDAKANGRPWVTGKAFDHSAPCGTIHRAADVGHPAKGRIRLAVNGEVRQDSDLSAMIYSVPQIVSRMSSLFELAPGDIIYTGTPAGVGPVVPGDVMVGMIEGLGTLTTHVGERKG